MKIHIFSTQAPKNFTQFLQIFAFDKMREFCVNLQKKFTLFLPKRLKIHAFNVKFTKAKIYIKNSQNLVNLTCKNA